VRIQIVQASSSLEDRALICRGAAVISGVYACAVPPECGGLTAEKLRDEGIFLWLNGSEAILFFGQRVAPQLIHATIGEISAFQALYKRSLHHLLIQESTQHSRQSHLHVQRADLLSSGKCPSHAAALPASCLSSDSMQPK